MSIRRQPAVFALLVVGTWSTTLGLAADPDGPVTPAYLAAVRKSAEKASTLVEDLQDDIVDELAGDKERTVFGSADASLIELELLGQVLAEKAPTREAVYKQFDRVDAKVAALVKAILDRSPKRPALARQAERLRAQSDELHFALSTGDVSAERQRQVLGRQAKSMTSAAKRFAVAADYALLDRPGRAPFLDAVKAFAERCEAFDKVAAGGDLDASKKEFSPLTEAWGRVVDGFLKLSPKEVYHIARGGFRLDRYHRQLFELLKMPGNRPVLSIKL
jgi:hypothetical protein